MIQFRISPRFVAIFSMAFGLLLAPSASAQSNIAVRAKVDKPKFDVLPSPDFGGNTGLKRFKQKDWLEVEVEFELDAKGQGGSDPEFVDEVVFKYYVAVANGEQNRANPAKFYLMEKEITHINIPVGEKIFSSVYLSPSSLRRITGSESAGKNSVKSVAVVMSHLGRPVGGNGTEGDVNRKDGRTKPNAWWTQLGGNTLVRTDKYPLLSKDETPFAALWWDRYSEIKKERR